MQRNCQKFHISVLEVLLHKPQVLFWCYNCEACTDSLHHFCHVCNSMCPYMDWNERVAVRVRFVLCMMQTRTRQVSLGRYRSRSQVSGLTWAEGLVHQLLDERADILKAWLSAPRMRP